MWGKIAVVMLALVIGLGAGVDALAQTAKPAKPGKPAQKSVSTTAAGQRAAPARVGTGAKVSRKPAAVRRTVPVKSVHRPAVRHTQSAKPPKPRMKHPQVAARSVRPAKTGQMRAAGRVVRPSSRGPSRAASNRRTAYQKTYALPETRRGTRYGRAPVLSLPPATGRPPAMNSSGPRTLSFYNVHTRRSLTVTYWRGGRYVQPELTRLNYFLRDSRDGDQVRMDPALFDILWQVRRQLRSTAPYHVLSAYRSPETNAWLASVSSGVASDSLHMRGQAMDVMLPDRSPAQIRLVARGLRRGGVGYYPSSGFVHVDTGPVRYW